MKTIKSITVLFFITPLLISSTIGAQIKHQKTETVKVYGNCGMCKTNIETTAYEKKTSMAIWNKDSKIATLSYDSTKTNSDAILKKIALAGYDNQNYLAPDAAYNKLAACCQYERKQGKTAVNHNDTDHNMSLLNGQTSGIQENKPLTPVYDAYFALKDVLIKSEGNAAAEKAKQLFKAIDAVPMEKLSASEHTVWMKYMKDLSYNAEHIKGTTEIDHQREHFTKLSAAMYEVMKTIKADYPVYFDHCPMYNDAKGGDWLSKEPVIKNPYYGSQMLSCGSTKEVIK